MKLTRIKIVDTAGFRSLQPNFEHVFRSEWSLQDELKENKENVDTGFAPFVCAGSNGSGKSNLLEAVAAIFFQLEVLRVRRIFLPSNFTFDEDDNPNGIKDSDGQPNAFELDYLIKVPASYRHSSSPIFAEVHIRKTSETSPEIIWVNFEKFDIEKNTLEFLQNNEGLVGEQERDFLLPEYVLGYSSGENEILSLPFFKMRFIQHDEYRDCLTNQFSYPDRPETRMTYIDNSFSQAILLCNLLYHQADALKPFQQDIGLGELQEFRIIIKRSIEINAAQAKEFGSTHPAITVDLELNKYTLNIVKLLEAVKSTEQDDKYERSSYVNVKNIAPMITRLKRCATCYFVDEITDTLYLDYCVNYATKQAFSENFDFEVNKSAIALFQAFQVLLTLNLYSVSENLKTDLYHSNSHYVSETVPVLASDERIMRFKFVKFNKNGIDKPVMLKDLSDGEHQLLHSLGLCLLFKDTNSLFLLDEPETHFNPAWRSNFISRLRECFPENMDNHPSHEMLITTHTPFLISDSERHKVLVFKKDKDTNEVSIKHPKYNTLGASINRITFETFDKRETIGGYAESLLDAFRQEFLDGGVDIDRLIKRIDSRLGDSVEKILLMKTIAESLKENE
ncbi:MAG: restriction system-associated AAA family ATPase [Moritella dasanensis]|jgi:restriction system-associated AAA family ATPase